MSPVDDELYRRLEVGPRASHEEIVHAYRRLAHGAHPDAHPDDPDASRRFRELTEAYDMLADPVRRAGYDRARASVPAQAEARRIPIAFGPPIVPGTRPQVGGPPLWAGPVQVDPGPRVRPSGPAAGPEPIDVLVAFLSRLFEERWLP
jgi:curved DNA-binding protein CbpA